MLPLITVQSIEKSKAILPYVIVPFGLIKRTRRMTATITIRSKTVSKDTIKYRREYL